MAQKNIQIAFVLMTEHLWYISGKDKYSSVFNNLLGPFCRYPVGRLTG